MSFCSEGVPQASDFADLGHIWCWILMKIKMVIQGYEYYDDNDDNDLIGHDWDDSDIGNDNDDDNIDYNDNDDDWL